MGGCPACELKAAVSALLSGMTDASEEVPAERSGPPIESVLGAKA